MQQLAAVRAGFEPLPRGRLVETGACYAPPPPPTPLPVPSKVICRTNGSRHFDPSAAAAAFFALLPKRASKVMQKNPFLFALLL